MPEPPHERALMQDILQGTAAPKGLLPIITGPAITRDCLEKSRSDYSWRGRLVEDAMGAHLS